MGFSSTKGAGNRAPSEWLLVVASKLGEGLVTKSVEIRSVIYMLGARDLTPTLSSFENFFPKFTDFQVLVYHYGQPYSAWRIKQMEQRWPNLSFIELHPEIPKVIDTKDLFWNRSTPYARRFGKSRLGYLHMCHLLSNPQDLPGLADFDYALQIDDDVALLAPLELDVFSLVRMSSGFFATSATSGSVSARKRDTREHLFEFVQAFVAERRISVMNKDLRHALRSNDEELFHSLVWSSCNFNIYRMAEFRTARWLEWAEAVNAEGGQYKYRWGDIEIIGIYGYLYFEEPLVDLRMVESGTFTPKHPAAMLIRSGFRGKVLGIYGQVTRGLKNLIRVHMDRVEKTEPG